MHSYPLFLDVKNYRVIIVGAGCVGQRKLLSIALCYPYEIILVDHALSNKTLCKKIYEQLELIQATDVSIIFEARDFQSRDIKGADIVFAATDNRNVNNRIASLCQADKILCNICDSKTESTFTVPSVIRQGSIVLAIGTEGNSPALSKKLRCDIEHWMGKRYFTMSVFLGRLRPLLLDLGMTAEANTKIFRSIVESPLMDVEDLKKGKIFLEPILPEQLHPFLGDLLHDL